MTRPRTPASAPLAPVTEPGWRWATAGYLFLTQLGAGVYVSGVAGEWAGAGPAFSRVAVLVAAPLVLLGLGCMLLHLGRMGRAFMVTEHPRKFWIERGFGVVGAFVVLAGAHAALGSASPAGRAGAWLGVATGVLGIGVVVQGAALLARYRTVEVWREPFLAPLLVLSALSSGLYAALLLGLGAGGGIEASARPIGAPPALLAGAAALLLAQGALAGWALVRMRRGSPMLRASAQMLARGRLAPAFWGGFFAAGLAAPLVASGLVAIGVTSPALLAPLLVAGLAGACLLRYALVAAGVRPMAFRGPTHLRVHAHAP